MQIKRTGATGKTAIGYARHGSTVDVTEAQLKTALKEGGWEQVKDAKNAKAAKTAAKAKGDGKSDDAARVTEVPTPTPVEEPPQ